MNRCSIPGRCMWFFLAGLCGASGIQWEPAIRRPWREATCVKSGTISPLSICLYGVHRTPVLPSRLWHSVEVHPEDGGSLFLWTVNYLPELYRTVLQPTRQQCDSWYPRDPQILSFCYPEMCGIWKKGRCWEIMKVTLYLHWTVYTLMFRELVSRMSRNFPFHGVLRAMASSLWRLLDHIERRTAVGRISLDRVIISSQRPHYVTTRIKHQTCSQRDSDSLSQHASGRGLTPATARTLRPALKLLPGLNYVHYSGADSCVGWFK